MVIIIKKKQKKVFTTIILFTIIIIIALFTNIKEKIGINFDKDFDMIIDFNTSENKNEKDYNNIKVDNTNFIEAYVKRVVDGDTIVAVIDDIDYKVRLIGVNSPESTTKIEEYGKEASNYTTSKLTDKTVYLEKDVSETDKYDRLLRYVWLEIPTEISLVEIKSKMFNAHLLIDGYAQIATYPPDVKYVDYFKKIQNEARQNSVGLWQK